MLCHLCHEELATCQCVTLPTRADRTVRKLEPRRPRKAMPVNPKPSTQARLLAILSDIRAKLEIAENAEAYALVVDAETVARQLKGPTDGFQHCRDCGALLRDRGQVVGHHLSDCKHAKPRGLSIVVTA